MVKDFTEDWAQIWRQMYDLSAIRVFLFSSVMQNKLDASYKSGETNAIIVAWCFSSSVINAAHAPLRQQWWLFKIISMTGCKNRLDLKETSFMYCILFKETNVFFLKKKIMFNKNTLSEIWLWFISYNPWHGVKKKIHVYICLLDHLEVKHGGNEPSHMMSGTSGSRLWLVRFCSASPAPPPPPPNRFLMGFDSDNACGPAATSVATHFLHSSPRQESASRFRKANKPPFQPPELRQWCDAERADEVGTERGE